jgi:hypothetical protein
MAVHFISARGLFSAIPNHHYHIPSLSVHFTKLPPFEICRPRNKRVATAQQKSQSTILLQIIGLTKLQINRKSQPKIITVSQTQSTVS